MIMTDINGHKVIEASCVGNKLFIQVETDHGIDFAEGLTANQIKELLLRTKTSPFNIWKVAK